MGNFFQGNQSSSMEKICNQLLSRDPWEMLKDGDFSHIELMMGTNQDEGNKIALIFPYQLVNAFNWVGLIFSR